MTELARGDGYRVELLSGGPEPSVRVEAYGQPIIDVRIGGGIDAAGQTDEPGPLSGPDVDDAGMVWRGRSKRWLLVEYRLVCDRQAVRFGVCVEGHGLVDRVRYFSGSQRHFDTLFNPQTAADRTTGFTPGPLCFVLEAPGACLAVGVAEGAGRLGFSEFKVLPSADGQFSVGCTYDGHQPVHGSWAAPELVLLPAAEPYQAVEHYCEWLRSRGLVPTTAQQQHPTWWREPMFCGWGEQMQQHGLAADNCTQANYERWLGVLEAHRVEPGMVVIDDKWQAAYGDNDFDARKWPDARGFIAQQHARGRRVVLWLQAWGNEGLPLAECVVDRSGEVVAADATQPAYVERLRTQIRRLLVDYDADGVKLDFRNRIPVGPGISTAGSVYGVDLMLLLVQTIHEAMRSAKPEALLIAQCANPVFAPFVDMVRLNGVPGITGQPSSDVSDMEHQARIVRAVSPTWLIDTDNLPSPERRAWRQYVEAQPRLGVPALCVAEGIRWASPGERWVDQPLAADDYQTIRTVWSAYRRQAGLPARE